jgi:predicted ATP-grasp superfamily ATP-dependent carboligase
MALGVVRALGEAGVRVVVLHYDRRDMAHVSRHASEEHTVPPPQTHEAEFVDAVDAHVARLGGGVVFPASDESAAAASRHKARLERRGCVVAAPPWEVARNFIEKRRTYELAGAAGVPTPVSRVVSSAAEAREVAAQVGFPLLVKPSQSHLFYERFHRKMVPVSSAAELVRHVEEARRAGLEVVLQELVPGPDTDVVNYNAYRAGGEAVVEFTARQLRKAPPHLGSPRVVRSERVPEVLEPGRATLRAIGFEGYACTEFKRDARDGRYRLLDVNGRHNLSGLLAVRCGINFPLLHYRHLALGEVPRAAGFTEDVYWVDVFRDAAYSLRYLVEEHHSPRTYLHPYLAKSCDAILDRSDPRPFLARFGYLARSLLRPGA